MIYLQLQKYVTFKVYNQKVLKERVPHRNMTLEIVLPQMGKALTTKDAVFSILAEGEAKTLTQLQREMKRRYKKLIKLGEGTYGIVWKAVKNDTGEICAIKNIRLENPDEGIPAT